MTKATPPRAAAQREAPPRPDRAKAIDGKRTVYHYDHGLELWVSPSGLRVWRCRVQRDGKRVILPIGNCPAMDIKDARAKAASLRAAPNPIAIHREEKAQAIAGEVSFREVAAHWVATRSVKAHWTDGVKAAVEARLARYVLPKLGDKVIADVTMDHVEALISAVHREHPRTAVFAKQHMSGIFSFAVRRRMIPFNPVQQIAEDLPIRERGDEKPNPSVGTIEEARAVLRAFEARWKDVSPWSLLAHRLIALTAVRKNEALRARWEEFDLDAKVWTIPAERVKGKHGQRRPHFVALSPQAIEVIQAANAIRESDFVFPSRRKQSAIPGRAPSATMDQSSLTRALREALGQAGLGPIMVTHGWRSAFSTIMNEIDDGASFRAIDVMLGHAAFRDHAEERDARKGSVERHYNRARYASARYRIACQWADLLLDGAPSAMALAGLDAAPATNVVPLRRTAA
jgi:integrase